MKKVFLTLAAAAALVTVGAASAQGGPSAADACKPGATTYKGARAKVFCGPASAVLKIGSRTITYTGGSCTRTSTAMELSIGTAILDTKDPAGPLPRYFGISVGRIFGIGQPAAKDGTYKSVTVAYIDGGKRFAGMSGEAKLTGGRTRGSFSAKLLTGQTVSGTFRCS